ncbi:STAS domain-containing protein [Actinophytocola algeriensis]|jgi:anti-anti-sigma factor|uniref:Anti-sigma factor antagonist n=1 Tax=Actinophytocola algeriensis TaxID=1768010 RepID=A0A7W7Q7C8_9PSEU|nr:STAS domain-containing protein [Actinophytocola algeriensis]MBB4908405.1 anti-anti-sigma factor [Actinophytocola algeriensis]MBE1475208.1 anti-anti-sigma factor [Actinophytocola algeriensis]
MELAKYMRGRVTVLALEGELDSATSGEARKRISELVPSDGAALLDLGGMTYMSSAGLRVLLLVYRQVRQLGVPLALARLNPDVAEVMTGTGFIDFFTVVDSVDDGVEALSG